MEYKDDYYEILGVMRNATQGEIKSAFRKLAFKWHPDKVESEYKKTSEERFRKILEAYEILSDENKRGTYDFEFSSKNYDSQNEQSNWSYNRERSTNDSNQEYGYNAFGGFSQNFENKKSDSGWVAWIVVSFFIIVGIYMYIIVSKGMQSQVSSVDMPREFKAESKSLYEGNQLQNGASPYNNFFGKGIYDKNSHCRLMIKNKPDYDAIACLTDINSGRTIRNEYIKAGSSFLMTKIPTGEYYIKAFSGKNWNPTKELLSGKIKGGFDAAMSFSKFDRTVKMEQYSSYDGIEYTSAEITLYTVIAGNVTNEQISADDFFMNNMELRARYK